jgi:hypothetical protein
VRINIFEEFISGMLRMADFTESFTTLLGVPDACNVIPRMLIERVVVATITAGKERASIFPVDGLA